MSEHINVKECKRIGGEYSILVCANCYNEIEASSLRDVDGKPFLPLYNFCPWCGTPIKEGRE